MIPIYNVSAEIHIFDIASRKNLFYVVRTTSNKGSIAVLVAYLIMLREGIEAALIVGIVAGYLRQTGRTKWMSAVWLGVAAALVLCLALGLFLNATSAEFPQKQQELFVGIDARLARV